MHANVASGIMTAALFYSCLFNHLLARCRIRLVVVPNVMFRFSGSHFYRSYSLSIENVSSPYAAFGLVMCALLIVVFILQSVEY